MKKLMGFCLSLFLLASCSDSGTGTRTDQMTDAAEQHNPSSDPNPQVSSPHDTTTGAAPDSSTVISYDTAARSKHN
ncbi:MAG: hypothetical protein EOO15_05875 [Chitinophagaceae bacterium]|nr:MAG: hypothetical protein EOO15_05875 [Chitinophagaceae bacterium]